VLKILLINLRARTIKTLLKFENQRFINETRHYVM